MLLQVLQEVIDERETESSTLNIEYVIQEIYDIGWERVLEINQNFTHIVCSIMDTGGRTHAVEIDLPLNYPSTAPKIQMNLPIPIEMEWSSTFHLVDCLIHIEKICNRLQPYLDAVDELNAHCWIIEPSVLPSYHITSRRIVIDQESSLVLQIRWDRPHDVILFESSCFLG